MTRARFLALVAGLEGILRVCVGLAFAVLIAAVLIQVVGRSLVSSSPVWTEELTRFALLFLVAFGVGVSYRSGDLVNVDILVEALPSPVAFALRFLSTVLTLLVTGALLVPAWRYAEIGALQTSPALGVRMTLIHASVLVLLAGLFVFSLARIVGMLVGADDGRPRSNLT